MRRTKSRAVSASSSAPLSSASASAFTDDSGVRSSCDTLLTNSRRVVSTCRSCVRSCSVSSTPVDSLPASGVAMALTKRRWFSSSTSSRSCCRLSSARVISSRRSWSRTTSMNGRSRAPSGFSPSSAPAAPFISSMRPSERTSTTPSAIVSSTADSLPPSSEKPCTVSRSAAAMALNADASSRVSSDASDSTRCPRSPRASRRAPSVTLRIERTVRRTSRNARPMESRPAPSAARATARPVPPIAPRKYRARTVAPAEVTTAYASPMRHCRLRKMLLMRRSGSRPPGR